MSGWFGTTRPRATLLVVTLRYRLTIFGSLPRATSEVLRDRFRVGGVSIEPTSTVLTGRLVDQPALRTLLILIWDVGGSVKSLEIQVESPATDGISPDAAEPRNEGPSTHPAAVRCVTEPRSNTEGDS